VWAMVQDSDGSDKEEEEEADLKNPEDVMKKLFGSKYVKHGDEPSPPDEGQPSRFAAMFRRAASAEDDVDASRQKITLKQAVQRSTIARGWFGSRGIHDSVDGDKPLLSEFMGKEQPPQPNLKLKTAVKMSMLFSSKSNKVSAFEDVANKEPTPPADDIAKSKRLPDGAADHLRLKPSKLTVLGRMSSMFASKRAGIPTMSPAAIAPEDAKGSGGGGLQSTPTAGADSTDVESTPPNIAEPASLPARKSSKSLSPQPRKSSAGSVEQDDTTDDACSGYAEAASGFRPKGSKSLSPSSRKLSLTTSEASESSAGKLSAKSDGSTGKLSAKSHGSAGKLSAKSDHSADGSDERSEASAKSSTKSKSSKNSAPQLKRQLFTGTSTAESPVPQDLALSAQRRPLVPSAAELSHTLIFGGAGSSAAEELELDGIRGSRTEDQTDLPGMMDDESDKDDQATFLSPD